MAGAVQRKAPIAGDSRSLLVEQGVLSLCGRSESGVTNGMIAAEYPGVSKKMVCEVLQKLLSKGKILVFKRGSTLLYKLKPPTSSSSSESASSSHPKVRSKEERLMYQIIQDADREGISAWNIRVQSKLASILVKKYLKDLMSRNLIKAVSSVHLARDKRYMLFDVTPDEAITGGTWYSNGEFDTGFVELLNKQCFRFLQQKLVKATRNHSDPISQREAACASASDVWKFITELGVCRVSLCVGDIETILNTLIYDGKAETTVVLGNRGGSGGQLEGRDGKGDLVKMYRAVQPHTEAAGLMYVPCGVCPVISKCDDTGPVTPAKCQYMKEWLW